MEIFDSTFLCFQWLKMIFGSCSILNYRLMELFTILITMTRDVLWTLPITLCNLIDQFVLLLCNLKELSCIIFFLAYNDLIGSSDYILFIIEFNGTIWTFCLLWKTLFKISILQCNQMELFAVSSFLCLWWLNMVFGKYCPLL